MITTNEKITDKEKNGLLGPVYQVNEMECGLLEQYGHIYVVEAYDENRFTIDCTETYNEEGKRIQEDRMWGVNKVVTFFDINGFEKEKNQYHEDGSLMDKYFKKCNDIGKAMEDIAFDKNGIQTSRSTRLYDDKWNCTKLTNYDKDDKITTIMTWVFGVENEKNNCFDVFTTDGEGKFINRYKYTRNKIGETIEIIEFNEDGSILKTTPYPNSCDSEGNKKEEYQVRTDKQFYKTIIENDYHGNWIKKMHYFCEKPISIYKRTIQYFGEAKKEDKNISEFETPFKIFNPVTIETDQLTINHYRYADYSRDLKDELTKKEAKWLAEKSASPDAFPYLNYYMLKNKEFPSQLSYNGSNVEVMSLLEDLTTSEYADLVHTYKINNNNTGERMMRYTLVWRKNPAYMIHIANIHESDSEEYNFPERMKDFKTAPDGQVRLSQIIVLYPSTDLGKGDPDYILSYIDDWLQNNTMEEIPEKPEIFMVEVANDGFTLESHYINDDFEIKELDVNYGFGFEQFHTELIQRFTTEHKGLVLFHGIPGTGKTYYIRHLLREMAIAKKIVIYMPPNMVDYLSEPGFMTFLSKTVAHYSAQNHTCILLIEDAEPLLVARHNEGRVQGITNLLNMSDGLLNDMLKLQIICTFNCELKQLDAALLRPGRLIARKEFKALPELEANILAQRLGVKYHFEEPATLSEIYAKIKNQNTIIHEE